jgi:PAS domain S-box-containing protein
MASHPPYEKPFSAQTGIGAKVSHTLIQTEEHCNTFAYEWDADSGVVTLSGDSDKVLGVKAGSHLTGRQILPRLHPDDVEKFEAALSGLTLEKPHTQDTYRVLHPERGVTQVEAKGRALFDRTGRMVRITGIVADMAGRAQIEPDLETANALLHLALEAGKSVGWDWDVRSGRDSWFGDLQTIFGIPSTLYRGHVEDFRRRVHADDRGLVWKAVREAMENRSPYIAQFRVIRSDGSVRCLSAQGRFYYLPGGEPHRMLGIAVDVTDRKAAEEALHRKDIELTEAQRLAGVGSWRWDPETDTVLWSDELYRIAGRDPGLPAPSYKDHAILYTSESWERLRHAVEEALWTGAPYELDVEMIRPDGTTRWLTARGEALRNTEGRIVRLRGTVQDITDRRRALEALRESEERLRLAAESGRMYAFEWDRATDVIVRSAEFAHILGLSSEPKETTCRRMLDTVHPDDRARVVAVSNACSPENPTYRVQYRVLRSDGSVVWLEKNGHAFFDRKGEMLRVIGMVTDITDRKVGEEALATLSRRLIEAQEAERARIARDLHDDIGQRLTLILMTLDQLKRSVVDTNGLSDRMDNLRKQVVDVSKSAHNLSHELHSATLRHLGVAEAMRDFCRELSEQQDVEIKFSHHDVPERVTPEISLCFFRILQEALHNAVKHSKVRRFDVELCGLADRLSLTIRDAGVGFDPQAALKGRGLGLISMQERLKLVNGELAIESGQTQGTAIHARAPLGVAKVSARAAR